MTQEEREQQNTIIMLRKQKARSEWFLRRLAEEEAREQAALERQKLEARQKQLLAKKAEIEKFLRQFITIVEGKPIVAVENGEQYFRALGYVADYRQLVCLIEKTGLHVEYTVIIEHLEVDLKSRLNTKKTLSGL